MLIFFLFTKIFFKNCSVNLLFYKNKKYQTNILKAPSRHKKFFHQVFLEFFNLKVFFYFIRFKKFNTTHSTLFFRKLNLIFKKFGTNTLTRTKFSLNLKINPVFMFL